MQKELNPELFGAGAGGTTRFREAPTDSATQAQAHVEEKIAQLRQNVDLALDQLASTVGQINDFIKMSQAKMDRTLAQVRQIEVSQQALSGDVAQRLTHLHQRLNERKTSEAKMQEMMDRHNGILRSYEVRMSQLQKLIAEKEHQALMSQAAFNEAKMELARLKRM